MDRPVLIRTTFVNVLIPELSQHQLPAGVHKAARIACDGRAVVARHGAVDRADWCTGERRVVTLLLLDAGVSGNGRAGVEWVRDSTERDLGEDVARVGEESPDGLLGCHRITCCYASILFVY